MFKWIKLLFFYGNVGLIVRFSLKVDIITKLWKVKDININSVIAIDDAGSSHSACLWRLHETQKTGSLGPIQKLSFYIGACPVGSVGPAAYPLHQLPFPQLWRIMEVILSVCLLLNEPNYCGNKLNTQNQVLKLQAVLFSFDGSTKLLEELLDPYMTVYFTQPGAREQSYGPIPFPNLVQALLILISPP